jgi:hypothetical protein
MALSFALCCATSKLLIASSLKYSASFTFASPLPTAYFCCEWVDERMRIRTRVFFFASFSRLLFQLVFPFLV